MPFDYMPQGPEPSPDDVSAPTKYQCSVCFKSYKRREHLFRHASSHTSERPHRCNSCNGSFQRGDVLKRHLRTCDGGAARSGGRRRACERCVRQKKACSARQPCQACSKKGLACFYPPELGAARHPAQSDRSEDDHSAGNRTDQSDSVGTTATLPMPFGDFGTSPLDNIFGATAVGFPSPGWQEYLLLASESRFLRDNPLLDPSGDRSLHFLDRFTSKTGFVASFDCGTQAQREQIASELEADVRGQTCQSNGFASAPQSDDFVTPLLVDNISDISTTDCIPFNWLNDPLSLKTHEILLLVEEVVTVKPRNSSVTLDWSSALKNACLQFFSPTNIRRLLGFYWAIWHPNINFVHRPTFDPVSAKPALVAAMMLIGACVSPDLPDNEDARMWFNCVEEIVFIDDDFNIDLSYSSSNSTAIRHQKIQILQAAYIVCLYQNWEGVDASKGRVRRHRFATMVSTARDIDITTATHLKYSDLGRHEFEWKEFAVREELIRILTWIFLLDTAFVIFNNLPPRMVIKEMKMHMAVPEACFQAMTADQCYQQIQVNLPPGSVYWKLSFRGAYEALAKDELLPTMLHALSDLGPLNLFALTSAIHSQLFQYRSLVGSLQNLTPIKNTLRHWRDTWQLFASTSSTLSPHVMVDGDDLQPRDMWRRVGFCRYCPEYWLLADLMADRLATLGAMEQGDGLLPLEDGPLDPILNRYDQTSMRQVNDLITGFQVFQI